MNVDNKVTGPCLTNCFFTYRRNRNTCYVAATGTAATNSEAGIRSTRVPSEAGKAALLHQVPRKTKSCATSAWGQEMALAPDARRTLAANGDQMAELPKKIYQEANTASSRKTLKHSAILGRPRKIGSRRERQGRRKSVRPAMEDPLHTILLRARAISGGPRKIVNRHECQHQGQKKFDRLAKEVPSHTIGLRARAISGGPQKIVHRRERQGWNISVRQFRETK